MSRVFIMSFSMLLFVAAAFVLLSGAHQAAAQTPTPTPPCRPSPTPGAGLIYCTVSATLPGTATLNANAVCVNCTGTGGQNNNAVLATNAAACASVTPTPVVPVVGAGGSETWGDWATACVAPGNSVEISFKSGGSTLVIDTVKWRLSDGSVIDGTGKVLHCSASVGGLAELPDVAGSSGPPYALLAGALAAVLALMVGTLYARRRLS